MDYVYYHFKTADIPQTWNTAEIEAFLQEFPIFAEYKNDGAFQSKEPFLCVHLMNVRSYDSWNSDDYDPAHTNYISVLTSDDWYWGIKQDPQIRSVLDGLERLLHSEMQEDW